MKRFWSLAIVLLSACRPAPPAQPEPVRSGVHRSAAGQINGGAGVVRQVVRGGTTTALARLDVRAVTLAAADSGPRSDGSEVLVIVTDGLLRVTMDDATRDLGPGSVALMLPGERYVLARAGVASPTYYEFAYRSKAPVNLERGRSAGGSFVVDWNDVAFRRTATGGRRNFFDRPTAMLERFEMHVTTLNAGLTNHAAHTHRAEEFVLLRGGEVRMLVGDARHGASAGDLVFLASMILHSLDNVGGGPAEYYAFQWQ